MPFDTINISLAISHPLQRKFILIAHKPNNSAINNPAGYLDVIPGLKVHPELDGESRDTKDWIPAFCYKNSRGKNLCKELTSGNNKTQQAAINSSPSY